MRIVIQPSASGAVEFAAEIIREAVVQKPKAVIGLATGGTMEPLYSNLIAKHQAQLLSFAYVTTFNLDEYVGLPVGSHQSYRHFMNRMLFDNVDIDMSRTHIPNGHAEQLDEECVRYEDAIRRAGGIDLQLLGIGSDGHIGFNEPGSSLASRTRVKSLAMRTRTDNARFFESLAEVPKTAITMGIATILDSRHILLLATGASKASAVKSAVEGPVSALVTASALQLHPNVVLVADKAAAAQLQHAADYEAAEEQRQLLQKQY